MLEPDGRDRSRPATFEAARVPRPRRASPRARAAQRRARSRPSKSSTTGWSEHAAPARPRRPGAATTTIASRNSPTTRGESLQEHLLWQLEMAQPRAARAGASRAPSSTPSTTTATSPNRSRKSRATLQPEIDRRRRRGRARARASCRRSIRRASARARVGECIELQLRQLDPETPGLTLALRDRRAIISSWSPTASCALLRRELRATDEELAARAGAGARLPSAPRLHRAARRRAEYVVPDVFVRRTDRGWAVEINPATLPRVRLNQSYAEPDRPQRRATPRMRAQLQEARWLLKSLEIRNETLMKVARSIVERQTAFLEHGEEHMRPMILKDIAEADRHARVDHLARHLRQVHAHAARRVRAPLLLFEPGRGRRRLGHLVHGDPRQDPEARQGRRTGQAAVATAASPSSCRARAFRSRAARSRSIARRMGIAPSNERRRAGQKPM